MVPTGSVQHQSFCASSTWITSANTFEEQNCRIPHQHSCTCCRYDQGVTAYIPCNKEWIKKKVSLAQVMLAAFCAFKFMDSQIDLAFLGCSAQIGGLLPSPNFMVTCPSWEGLLPGYFCSLHSSRPGCDAGLLPRAVVCS